MHSEDMVVEYKDRHLTRPLMDQIVGAAVRTNPDAKEVVIMCATAASTALEAQDEFEDAFGVDVTIIEAKK